MIPAVVLLRYGLAAVLAVAALGKLRRLPAFRRSLSRYGLRGGRAGAAAWAVVAVEALAAALILAPVPVAVAGAAGTILGTVFTGLQVFALARGDRAPCLCFGAVPAARASAPARLPGAGPAVAVLGAGLILLLAG
ncbi:MauE/DoxX family redox-associated membrane protein [Thermostaphylospora chromogena]|uniref:Methylamine utilisation protein MauE domain-containing protein n=1 Tax=Thermostaphylospora chromogena TaxID=35622 RepID=A0A1H1FUP8_9ACTN|nr:MauE/DoxX family redox-associated membrane protein [Thermostaphylospora chromogena]SDR04733.1 hypothetical protein SAMN04489764_3198 [Thermostaphylospora chromogena]